MPHRSALRSFVIFWLFLVAIPNLDRAAEPGAKGPDPRYYNYDEILERIDQWGRDHADIVHREAIGRSRLGEPIWAVKISDHPDEQEQEPTLLFHAAQHSNETNGANAIVYTIDHLLDRYATDEKTKALVDGLQIWFIPVVNIDGHRRVFEGGSDWAEWRKTMRDNNHDGHFSCPTDGVDMNRNWDYRWAEYGAVGAESQMYKGPHPFSEPEVVSLRDFILREMPVIVMDYHSPGTKTFPNMIFWPWFEKGSGQSGPDSTIYRQITQDLARRTLTEIDTLNYNGDWYSYDTLPKEQCWVYRHTGVCILLMEISTKFWWEGAIVDTIAARVGRGSFYLMERALGGPGLTGNVTDAETGEAIAAEIQVLEAHDPRVGPRMTDGKFGRYWRLLNPGVHTVTCLAAGYEPSQRMIDIGTSEWTELDFRLRRPLD